MNQSVTIPLDVVNDGRIDDAAMRIYIMLVAAGAAERAIPVNQQDLADYLSKNGRTIDRKGVNRRLQKLENAGYIEKFATSHKQRAYQIIG